MDGIKLVNVGAGSLYTPDFGKLLHQRRDQIPIKEWVLMDNDEERLMIVGKFTESLIIKAGSRINISYSTDIKEAVKDADYVISTIRVGKAQARVLDEQISIQHGMIGQETTAPGGLAMGLRNIPPLVEIAKNIEEYAKPEVWLVNLANPAGMLTEAVCRYTRCKIVGLCNWPTIFWNGVADGFNVGRDDVFLRFVGINHMNWSKAYVNGRDVGFEALEKFTPPEGSFLSTSKGSEKNQVLKMMSAEPDLLDFIGWPLFPPYDRLYYETDEMHESDLFGRGLWDLMSERLKDVISPEVMERLDMRNVTTRAETVAIIDELAVELYAEMNEEGFLLVQNTRGGASYGEAGLNLIDAIVNNKSQVQIVDHPNMGSIKDIPYDYVVESPCLVNGAGVWPIAMGEVPAHMLALIQEAKQYEILAAKAAMTGDYHAALEALVTTPILHSFEKSMAVLNGLLVAHKKDLPNFKEAIAKIEKGERPY